MSEPRRAESDDLVIDCRVTTTPAFSSIVEALSARIGEFAGCPAGDAGRLGQAVRLVFERAGAVIGGESELDLDFRGNGRLLHVDVHCPVPVAEAFADLQEGEGAERLRALVDRSEVHTEGDGTRCRLTQQIRHTS